MKLSDATLVKQDEGRYVTQLLIGGEILDFDSTLARRAGKLVRIEMDIGASGIKESDFKSPFPET